MKRKIVHIDQEKCNGCGLCVGACHEGAIQMVDGKAKLVSDIYCDGLGDCLGECPVDAITIEEREADGFDPKAVEERLKTVNKKTTGGGCPGMRALSFPEQPDKQEPKEEATDQRSELRQWPIQLHLVPVQAPYWQDAELLVAADCVAAAFPNFHSKMLKGKRLIIACPKLDDTRDYTEKLTAIIKHNDIKSISVARMEVPCCGGIVRIAEEALERSGKSIPMNTTVVSLNGETTD